MFLLLGLFPVLFFFLFFPFLNFLSLLLSGIRFKPQRLLNFSRILNYLVALWLFVAEIVFCFVLVHFNATLFVLLVNLLGLFWWFCSILGFFHQPFLAQNVFFEEQIRLVHLLFILPYTFYQLLGLWLHFVH